MVLEVQKILEHEARENLYHHLFRVLKNRNVINVASLMMKLTFFSLIQKPNVRIIKGNLLCSV
jgi:hypothetical protein